MMKRLHPLLALFLLCAAADAVAQSAPADSALSPRQTIRGSVRDAATGQPIVGATIAVVGTRRGAVSRSDGSFEIRRAEVGRLTIHVSSIGYEPTSLQIILSSGRQAILDVELQQSVIESETVVISGDPFKPINESALVSAQSFSVEEVGRYAGAFDDPGRIAQNFAGVTGTDDRTNDIVVRGGSPTELLWRLDGIDIPNPNHFATQGASGGPINAINSNFLANSDFLTGAFPAEYGTRLSAVFDLRSRRGNPEKYEFVAQLGFNGLEGMVEGPIPGTEGSFITSYRRSALEVFDLLGVSLGIGAIVPRYQDATLKVDLPLGPDDALSVTALGGISTGDEDDPELPLTGWIVERSTTRLAAAGISWTRLLSDELVGRLSLSTQYNGFRYGNDSLTTDGLGSIVDRTPVWERRAGEGSHALRYRLSWAPSARHTLTAGAEGRLLYFNLGEEEPTHADVARYVSSGQSGYGIGYLDWTFRPASSLTISAGIFTHLLGLNGTLSAEPRAGLSWELADGQSINAGFGVHRQMQPLVLYMENPENRDLGFTQSLHYVLGYTSRLAPDWQAKIEGYYKSLSDAPVTRDGADPFSMLNVGPDFEPSDIDWPLANNGLGRAYGVDLSLIKHFTDGYYVTATGSFFRQEYTGSDGIWRYGVFDNRYVVNLLTGYEWEVSQSFTIDFGIRYTLAGGRRTTPIDLEESRRLGYTIIDRTRPYADVFPPYERLDVRVDFRNNFDGWSLISYISVLNALDHDNILQYRYNAYEDRIVPSTQLGLIPVGGIRFEF